MASGEPADQHGWPEQAPYVSPSMQPAERIDPATIPLPAWAITLDARGERTGVPSAYFLASLERALTGELEHPDDVPPDLSPQAMVALLDRWADQGWRERAARRLPLPLELHAARLQGAWYAERMGEVLTRWHADLGTHAERALLDRVSARLRELGRALPEFPQEAQQARTYPTSKLRKGLESIAALLDTAPFEQLHSFADLGRQEELRRRVELAAGRREEEQARLAGVRRRQEALAGRPDPAAREEQQRLTAVAKELEARVEELDRQVAARQRAYVDFERTVDQRIGWLLAHRYELAAGRVWVRELRARAERVLAELTANPPPYLVAELGPPPAGHPARARWLEAAHALESYRADQQLTSLDRALDPPPAGTDPDARARYEQLLEHLDQARTDLAHRPDLGYEQPAQNLDLL